LEQQAGNVTVFLARLSAGETGAAERLLPVVYEELRALAGHYFKKQRSDHTLQPTALVHEAYLKLIGQERPEWQSRAHFLAVAATAMRQILANHARDRKAVKRGGSDRHRITLDRALAAVESDVVDVIDLDDSLCRLAAFSERQARVVELRAFGGLTIEEAAHVLGVGQTTIKSDWQFAKAWLKRELAATNGWTRLGMSVSSTFLCAPRRCRRSSVAGLSMRPAPRTSGCAPKSSRFSLLTNARSRFSMLPERVGSSRSLLVTTTMR